MIDMELSALKRLIEYAKDEAAAQEQEFTVHLLELAAESLDSEAISATLADMLKVQLLHS